MTRDRLSDVNEPVLIPGYGRLIDLQMTDLYGLIIGIGSQGEIGNPEIEAIRAWMEGNSSYRTIGDFAQCFDMLEGVLDDNIVSTDEFSELIDYTWPFVRSSEDVTKDESSSKLLQGIFRGIMADGKLTNREISWLRVWLEENSDKVSIPGLSELTLHVTKALEDRVINADEHALLTGLLSDFLNDAPPCNISQ